MGSTLAGIGLRAAVSGSRQLATGQRPTLNKTVLTPGNALRLTQQLAKMRGAAMKVGQLISMDADQILPAEFAEIVGHLRSDGHFMPPAQLKKVLTASWGASFTSKFRSFDVRPIAAASIGQVHRATRKDGTIVAVKVQYPGIRDSIDSDIRNIRLLLKGSRMVPWTQASDNLLEEARLQLHTETDYIAEAKHLITFRELLAQDARFIVPALHADLSDSNILVTDFVEGRPIDAFAADRGIDQGKRSRVARDLISLFLTELFEFGLMQTDPNFANYLVKDDGRIVLLDFGATRSFAPDMRISCYRLMQAAVDDDEKGIEAGLHALGVLNEDIPIRHRELIHDVFDLGAEAMRTKGLFDFQKTDLLDRAQAIGFSLASEPQAEISPPADIIFLQRKIAGLYFLAKRLDAKIDIASLIAEAPSP